MYIFCTDPPIEEYKSIYKNFKRVSGYKVHASSVIQYFWDFYRIPYGHMCLILRRYTNDEKTDVTEYEFLELMVRWYYIQVSNLRGRMAVFNKIDQDKKCFITYNDIRVAFNETNTSAELRTNIETVLKRMGYSDNFEMDFFDYLAFMFILDPKERLTL